MKDMEERKNWYSRDLEQRKYWYSAITLAYNKARPRYPQDLIVRAAELAQLSKDKTILEIGCGPGTATVSFAQLGFSIVCLEPSLEACQLAQENCALYPDVKIINTTFEDWELKSEKFNAVLAATSFHWVLPEIRYTKAAAALKDKGSLILLMNTGALPQDEVYQLFNEVYQTQDPFLAQYHTEERIAPSDNLFRRGQDLIQSSLFKDLGSEQVVCKVTYSIDNYLLLLSTYSPYIALDQEKRDSLFQSLRETLEANWGKSFQAEYLSTFHIAQKI